MRPVFFDAVTFTFVAFSKSEKRRGMITNHKEFTMSRHSLKLLLAISLLTATMAVSAAWVPPRCDRAAVLTSAAKVTVAAYPDADSVLLSDCEAVRYNPDGTAESTDDCYEKILTQKGKQERRQLSFHYRLPYSIASLETLEIIRAGKTIPIDVAKNSRVQVDPSQMGMNIFDPNSKILAVQVPDLQPGDILHYTSRRRDVKTNMPNTWCEYFLLQSTSPILNYRIVVDAPASRPLRCLAIKDEVKGTVTFREKKSGDRIIYEWDARNVPRIFEEPGMPPYFTVVQRLLVSTVPDWNEISRWYWKLCLPHLEKTTPAMAEKVKELTRGLTDPQAKIQAIFHYVAHQIRYMGITTETDAPGFEPHDVNITFEHRYGVCRDKAALLVAMLRLAGFNARPVLFYNGPKKDKEVPNSYFNHAIVGVEMAPGDYQLMDPTDENSRELFPAYLCDKSYLVARPDGDVLRTSAVTPAERNMVDIVTEAELNAAGTMKATSVIRFDGVNDGIYRGAFIGWKPEKREEFFASRLRQALPGATLRKIEITPTALDDVASPLKVTLNYDVPDFLIGGKAAAMVRLPWLGTQFGMVNFVLSSTGLEQRRFPMKLDSTCGVTEKFTMRTALAQPLLLPQFPPEKQRDFAWAQKLSWQHGVLTGDAVFQIRTMEITPSGYSELKNLLRRIEFERRKMPLFAAKDFTNGADSVILRNETKVELLTESSWTMTEKVSRKILTYAGKKSAAELKFSYNPVWTDFTLIAAKVTAADGKVMKVKAEEVNLMDAAWVGSAPRYPAGKIKVVSLPGVDVGCTIDYEVKYTFRDRPFFDMVELFRHSEPIVSASLQLTAPSQLAEKMHTTGVFDGVKTQTLREGDKTVSRWTTEGVAKYQDERNLPPPISFCPYVMISTGNWNSYATELNRNLNDRAAGQSECQSKARELMSGAKDKAAGLRAVNQFILKNIRLTGPAFSQLPLTSLSAGDVVLRDGYGHSADRAVVFVAMLKAAGFDPELVTVGNYPAIESLYSPYRICPSYALMNTVLVRVSCDGEVLYLNADNHYGIPGINPYNGYPALDLSSGQLIRVTAPPRLANRVGSDVKIDFDLDGNALITRRSCYYGDEYSSFRKSFLEMTPELRRRFFMEEAAGVSQAARIVSADVDTNSYPLVKTMVLKVPRFAVRDGNYLYFNFPGAVLRQLLPSGGEKRTMPYYYRHDENIEMTMTATIAGTPARVIMKPGSWRWQAPDRGGMVTFRFSQEERTFCLSGQIMLRPAVIMPYRFNEYLWVSDRLGSPASWQMAVEMPASASGK